jgi:hypothetical protein
LLDHGSELVFVELLFDVFVLVLRAYAVACPERSSAAQTARPNRLLALDMIGSVLAMKGSRGPA